MAQAKKIKKYQEKASLKYIPQSIYNRAMVQLFRQKYNRLKGITNTLLIPRANNNPLIIILKCPRKVNINRLNRGIINRNIIINKGNSSIKVYLLLI